MKKVYCKPSTKVIKLKTTSTLLVGSDPTRSVEKATEDADENYDVL